MVCICGWFAYHRCEFNSPPTLYYTQVKWSSALCTRTGRVCEIQRGWERRIMTIVNNAAGKSAGGTVIEEKWHSSRVFLMTRPITPIDGIRPTSFVNSIPNGFVVSRGKVSLITLNAHYYIVHFAAYLCRSTQETISVVFGVAIRFCVSFQLWSPNRE